MGVPAAVFCFRFLVSCFGFWGLGMMAVSKVEKNWSFESERGCSCKVEKMKLCGHGAH